MVYKAHKNKIPTVVPTFLGMTFLMAIIFTSPGVAVIPEINMADKKAEVVSVWQMLLTSQRCKRCERHRSWINTVRIYCKSIVQDGNH